MDERTADVADKAVENKGECIYWGVFGMGGVSFDTADYWCVSGFATLL